MKKLKHILFTALVSAAVALPGLAAAADHSGAPALTTQQSDSLANAASTNNSCWVYIPGFGWIFVC